MNHYDLRKDIKKILSEYFQEELLKGALPESVVEKKHKLYIDLRAEDLLKKFEDSIITEEITKAILMNIRSDIIKVRRIDKLIDIGLIISPLAIGILVTILTSNINIPSNSFHGYLFYTIIILSVLQFALYCFAKAKK